MELSGPENGRGRRAWDDGRDQTRRWLTPEQGQRVKYLISRAGLTQQQLADETHLSYGQLSKALGKSKDRRRLQVWQLQHIARRTGTPYAYLLDEPPLPGPPDAPRDVGALDNGAEAYSMLAGQPPPAGQAGQDQPGTRHLGPSERVEWPLTGRANAGRGGGLAAEGEYVAIAQSDLVGREPHLLLVCGSCMDKGPNAVRDGDYIIVDHAASPVEQEPVCVRVKSTDEVIFKLWHRLDQEHVELIPRDETPGIGRRQTFALCDLDYIGAWRHTIRTKRVEVVRCEWGPPPTGPAGPVPPAPTPQLPPPAP